MNFTLKGILEASVAKNGNYPAVAFVGEKPYTYNEFYQKVKAACAQLEALNVQPEDKVAILSSNQPNWGVAFFAVTSLGAVAVPILPDFHENEIENVLNHSETKVLYVSESLVRRINGINIPTVQQIIQVEDFAILENRVNSEIPTFDETAEPAFNFNPMPDSLASIIYTSGTTGKSKGVILTHKNLVFTAINSGKIHFMDTHDRLLSLLPLSHTYENTLGLILPIMSGSAIYYLRKPPVPSVLMPALKLIRPTIILSVPLIIEKVFKGKVLPELNSKAITRTLYKFAPTRKLLNRVAGKKVYETFGGKLEFFGVGGAKLDPEVERFLIEGKFPYAVGYGLTETAPLLAGFDSYQGKHQSTGPTMQGITLKINDPDPKSGEGEIWAKGDNVMIGYYKEPELTQEVLTEDGWFKTGDLGKFDKSGYLFIKGRLKNMIVGSSGENIYPEEIEAIINRFKFVLESVVVQKKGKLVAMVHFNIEELESRYKDMKDQANQFIDKKIEELLIELQEHVNSQVNKFSKLQLVVAQPVPFEKTATKKIKRFLYY